MRKMNRPKREKADLVGNPVRSELMDKEPVRPEATMDTDAQVRKQGGRLSREDQRRLGDMLQRVYDDVVSQGVPDRFKELLTELEESREDEPSGPRNGGRRGEDGGETGPDRLLGAKADQNPSNKGSSR
jgi:hypothetical protein